MVRLIQVGNLSDSIDDLALRQLFELHGGVRSAMINRHFDTGRSTGVGFVEMASAEGSAAAIAALHHQENYGRVLSVCWRKSSKISAADYGQMYGPMNMIDNGMIEEKHDREQETHMQSELSGTHQKIYQRVFEHPMPHNLQWREVWSMFGAMNDVNAVEENGRLKVTRNGQTLSLHRPRGKDLADKKELMQVRHFLERSETPAPPSAAAGVHLLVVIDHREARIYRAELHGATPQRISSYDPFGFARDLHYNQDDSNGQRKPENKSFYEAVAKTLHGAEQILMFGTGTGASHTVEHLRAELKRHHADIAKQIIGTITVNGHHLTEDQLLAKARELFIVTESRDM